MTNRWILALFGMAILALIVLIFYTPWTFAGDLTVAWTTQPGTQRDKEVVIFGDPAKGPDDPKAVKVLVQKDLTKTVILESTIRQAFPSTDYLGITARNVGDTKWWVHQDGTYTFVPWAPNVTTPPVVITPPVVKFTDEQVEKVVDIASTIVIDRIAVMKKLVGDALDKCLAKPVQKHEVCMKTIRDALKKETK